MVFNTRLNAVSRGWLSTWCLREECARWKTTARFLQQLALGQRTQPDARLHPGFHLQDEDDAGSTSDPGDEKGLIL